MTMVKVWFVREGPGSTRSGVIEAKEDEMIQEMV